MYRVSYAEARLRREDLLREAARQRLINSLKQPERPIRRAALALNLRPSELRPAL